MVPASHNPTLGDGNLPPRLASSLQWTPVPAELIQKVQTVFKNQFDIEAEHGEFLAEGRIYPEELVVRVGYLETGRLKQINFEASMDLKAAAATESTLGEDAEDEEGVDESFFDEESFGEAVDGLGDFGQGRSKTMQNFFVAIDALGSAMEEYFELGEDEEIEIPLQWRAFDFEGQVVYLRHSTVNTRLEDEADRLLGLADGLTDGATPAASRGLFNETRSSEDALNNAEIDAELAFEIQKAIRAGKFQLPKDGAQADDGDESHLTLLRHLLDSETDGENEA